MAVSTGLLPLQRVGGQGLPGAAARPRRACRRSRWLPGGCLNDLASLLGPPGPFRSCRCRRLPPPPQPRLQKLACLAPLHYLLHVSRFNTGCRSRCCPAGGPFPVIGGPGHEKLTAFLKRWPQQLAAKPKQILVISGHWEVSGAWAACVVDLLEGQPWLLPLHCCCRCHAAAAAMPATPPAVASCQFMIASSSPPKSAHPCCTGGGSHSHLWAQPRAHLRLLRCAELRLLHHSLLLHRSCNVP